MPVARNGCYLRWTPFPHTVGTHPSSMQEISRSMQGTFSAQFLHDKPCAIDAWTNCLGLFRPVFGNSYAFSPVYSSRRSRPLFQCDDKRAPVSSIEYGWSGDSRPGPQTPRPLPPPLPRGPKFIDVTESCGTKQSWSLPAPSWRQAEKGLSIEGKCKNVRCKAHGSNVIVNKGMTSFNVSRNYDQCLCPLCSCPVVPEKPGFNNCVWRVIAEKFDSKSKFRTKWTRTNDEYCTYDELTCGMSIFSNVQIFVKDLAESPDAEINIPVPRSCMICVQPMAKEALYKLSCQNIIHKFCSEKWARVQRDLSCELTCPSCDVAHLSPADAEKEVNCTRVAATDDNAVAKCDEQCCSS